VFIIGKIIFGTQYVFVVKMYSLTINCQFWQHNKGLALSIFWRVFTGIGMALMLSACGPADDNPWNNPYPVGDGEKNILYSSFDERPKHLDPIRSYSSNEYSIIANIYEPPLQYHYLKRPYELVPLTANAVPVPYFLDEKGNRLPSDAPVKSVSWSIYDIEIQPGIRYQPHPALATDAEGIYRYHAITEGDLADIYTLSDFLEVGTRELTAIGPPANQFTDIRRYDRIY
jgi:hypothetical protein